MNVSCPHVSPPLAHRLVALVKSSLGKGVMTDFQVRQWGIRRTWKSVVPLNQQAVTLRVVIGLKLGYLLNFGAALMKDGITRTIHGEL